MSKKLMDGVWILVCDWKDPETGTACELGTDEEPAQFVDPDQGRDPDLDFQCGRHHGVVPQAERPEFQLPDGHKLSETVMLRGNDAVDTLTEEEVGTDD